MKKMIIVFILFFVFWVGEVSAKTVYVTDSLQITMRAVPGNRSKIVRMISSNTPLEVLSESDGWLKVKYGDKEGWVLERFTKQEKPEKVVLDELQERNAQLEEQFKLLTQKADTLDAENSKLKSDYEQTSQNLQDVSSRFEQLQKDSSQTIELKNKFLKVNQSLDLATAKLKELQKENEGLRSSSMTRWFLAGAGVFGGAWFIGFILGRLQRKQKPRLY